MSLRCLLADDHPALVVAISDFLGRSGFEVVGVAPDGEEAVAIAVAEHPDVALVDFHMPKLGGVELVKRLRAEAPDTHVVVYTAEANERIAEDVIRAGAAGVVLKEAPLVDLVRALESVTAGRTYVDPALSGLVLVRSSKGSVHLTDRERDVLVHLAEGLSHAEIGTKLGISGETVRTHVQKACERLGASTRTQAVASALRQGLIG
jgi:DNA-binding NarL/FixJ family response regulator